MQDICEQENWGLIDNSHITNMHFNPHGLHLNKHSSADIKLHQPQRRIPYHIREKVHDAPVLEKQDSIERVPEKQSTPWVSPIVPVPKKRRRRIYVGMHSANKAIQRNVIQYRLLKT